jgi:hypothetical protein
MATDDFIPADQFESQAPDVQPASAQPHTDDFIPEGQFVSHEDAYGSTGQQVLGAVEGIAKGIAGPVATGLEKNVLKVSPEDIKGRAEANPIAHGIGEAAGLGLGMLTGTGEAAVMEKAGEAAAKAAGLAAPATTMAKIGSMAVKQAAEMAVLQSGDEASKMLLHDPDQSAQSAMANVGLASVLGGGFGAAFGAVNPLWNVTIGHNTNEFLGALSSKLGGIEGAATASDGLATRAGVEIPEIIKAKIDDAPGAAEMFSTLSQKDSTYGGRKAQETVNEFRSKLSEAAAETLGVDAKGLKSLPELDKYVTGQGAAESLEKDLKDTIEPITKDYDRINASFKASPMSQGNIAQTVEAIAQKSIDEGWHKAESDAAVKLMDRVMEKLPKQETAEDLKKFITNLREAHPFGSDTYKVARDIAKIIEEGRGRAVSEAILAKGGGSAEAAAEEAAYRGLKTRYGGLMDKLEALNEHLHVGSYDGPQSFLTALKDMSATNAEAIINRLSGANKAHVLELLAEVSPNTLAKIRQYHVEKMVSAATKDGILSIDQLMTQYEKLTPQLKSLVAGPEQQARLEALRDIAYKMQDPTRNWTNTARTIDKLTKGAASPITLIATFMGHGAEALLAHVGSLGFTEGRDAIKLSMLKFLGSNQTVKPGAFKAMVEFAHSAIKGETTLQKAAKAVFKPGAQVLAENLIPNATEREKLDKVVTKSLDQPDSLLRLAQGEAGHYIPDHQMKLAESATRAVTYLQTLKPHPIQLSPLDRPIEPSGAQIARYNRALDIAQQPAIVMQHIKQGTLVPSDIQDLQSMYPGLYERMTQKLSNEMINRKADDEAVPYKVRTGISLFLGQPVDSTMTPAAIMAAQPQPKPQQAPQGQGSAQNGGKGKPSALKKMPSMYQTPGQAAAKDRADRE